MKIFIDRQIYIISFDDPYIKSYLDNIIKLHNVTSSQIIFDEIREILYKSYKKTEVNRYLRFVSLDITFKDIKGDTIGTCGYMDNYITTLAKETNSDNIIYFKNKCFERMTEERTTPKTIHIYDFINKFI